MIYPTSNGRRHFSNGISSLRELNCITISMRHPSLYPANIGMPISTLIKMVHSRRLFRFRSRYLSAVELSTSFLQPNSIVADIKTITKCHFHVGFADMNIDIYLEKHFIYRYRSDIDCKIGHISLRHGMNDVVSTSELHGFYMDTKPGGKSTLHENDDIETMVSKIYQNGIFTSAPVLKPDFWHRMVDIVFSSELDRIYMIRNRPIHRSNTTLPLLKRYRNGVFH